MKKVVCFFYKHKVQNSYCPYTKKTYQTCARCGMKGIKL